MTISLVPNIGARTKGITPAIHCVATRDSERRSGSGGDIRATPRSRPSRSGRGRRSPAGPPAAYATVGEAGRPVTPAEHALKRRALSEGEPPFDRSVRRVIRDEKKSEAFHTPSHSDFSRASQGSRHQAPALPRAAAGRDGDVDGSPRRKCRETGQHRKRWPRLMLGWAKFHNSGRLWDDRSIRAERPISKAPAWASLL